jgi:16S rRNA (guanine527-N7)-methyltransferase
MDNFIHINTFCSLIKVSRETITSLKIFEEQLKKANKTLNLISKSTLNNIWGRHFLDSAQLIDFIDKNDKIIIDLGSGAGFPGLIIAIMAKDRRIDMKVKLIEKSPKKVKFLNQIIKKLNLNVETINQNVFEETNDIAGDVIVARAFKPLQEFLTLIHNKAINWKKIIVFLGKTGKEQLLQASNSWDIQYKQRISITSSDSIIIEVNKLKKK